MKSRRAIAALAVAVLSIAGCSGDGPSQPTGFSLAVQTDEPVQVSRGISRTIEISVTRTGDFHGAIALRLADANDFITADPATIDEDAANTQLTIHIGPGAPFGENIATIEGSANGFAVVRIPVTLNVAGTGSFSMSIGSYPAFVARGQVFQIPITIVRSDFAGAVTLAIDQPSGFFVEIQQPGTGTSGVVQFTVGPNVLIGSNYTLRLTASATGVAMQEAVILFGVGQ